MEVIQEVKKKKKYPKEILENHKRYGIFNL